MEKTNCGETNDVIDRISILPDVVQAHILSFLSTKEAVGTCVLSKGWKNTWSSVPVLRFNFKEFLPVQSLPHKQNKPYEQIVQCEPKFKQFVKGVLKNRDSSHIDKFELVWRTIPLTSCSSEDLEGCILPAMKFKPRVLSVNVLKREMLNFKRKVLNFDTDPIFSCESLEDVLLGLDVNNGYLKIAPTSVHLPFLKKLHLIYLTLGDDFVNKLFMGCPVLEELSLSDCDLKVSKISSGTLKKFFLMSSRHEQSEQSWEISTPSLVNLELSVLGHMEGISLNKMASLLNARIHFRTPFDYKFTNSEPKFLSFLSNVTKLDLALNDAQPKWLLEKEVPNCQIFNNLKTLKLGCWCMSIDFELVAFFLRSPNLQRLKLYHCNAFSIPRWEWEDDTEENSSQEETGGALFQQEQLEIVKIINVGVWRNDECTDLLVNKLQAHVKTIGKIIITDYGSSTLLRVF